MIAGFKQVPIILAMNNPHSADPGRALEPHPQGSAGHRLATMFHEACERHGAPVTFESYLKGFWRMNLLDSTRWVKKEAELEVPAVRKMIWDRRTIICGRTVQALLKLPRTEWLEWAEHEGCHYCTIPHPSGLTREYNDPEMRAKVGDLLLTEFLEAHVSA